MLPESELFAKPGHRNMQAFRQVNIEQEFDACVRKVGGEIVAEIVGPSPGFSNADFLFRQLGVVAELKCLQKDILEDSAYQNALSRMYSTWVAQKLIPDPGDGPIRVQTKTLPDECQTQIFQLLEKPTKEAIKKANRQIRETKEQLNLSGAKGLLLLANDGCWGLQSNAVLYIVDKVLANRFHSINTVVYFTPNMPALFSDLHRIGPVWVQCPRKGIEQVDAGFLDILRTEWTRAHGTLLGEKMPEIKIDDPQKILAARFTK
jgi:hypothetical protein